MWYFIISCIEIAIFLPEYYFLKEKLTMLFSKIKYSNEKKHPFSSLVIILCYLNFKEVCLDLSFSTLEAREQLQGNKDVNFHLQGKKKE